MNEPARPPTSLNLVPARREARLVALALDALLLALALALFVALGALTVLLQTDWLAVDPTTPEWTWGGAVMSIWLALPLIYFTAGAHGGGITNGGTLSARVMGLTVRAATGQPPSLRRALVRSAAMYFSLGVLGIGVLVSLFDRQGRTLHDALSGTCVLERERPPDE